MGKYEPIEKYHATSGLAAVMTDNLTYMFNWDGLKNKIEMKNLALFKKILYGKHRLILLNFIPKFKINKLYF